MVNPAVLRNRRLALEQKRKRQQQLVNQSEIQQPTTQQQSITESRISRLTRQIKQLSNQRRASNVSRIKELQRELNTILVNRRGGTPVEYSTRLGKFIPKKTGVQVGTIKTLDGRKIKVSTSDPLKLRQIQKKQIKQDLKNLSANLYQQEQKTKAAITSSLLDQGFRPREVKAVLSGKNLGNISQKQAQRLFNALRRGEAVEFLSNGGIRVAEKLKLPNFNNSKPSKQNNFDSFRQKVLDGVIKRSDKNIEKVEKELKNANFRKKARVEFRNKVREEMAKRGISGKVLSFLRTKLDISPELLLFSEKQFIGTKQLGSDLSEIADRDTAAKLIVTANLIEAYQKGQGKKFINETYRALKSQNKDSIKAAKTAIGEAIKDPSTYALALLGARPVRVNVKPLGKISQRALSKAESNLFKLSKSLGKIAKTNVGIRMGKKGQSNIGTRIKVKRTGLGKIKTRQTVRKSATGKKQVIAEGAPTFQFKGSPKTLKGSVGRKPASQRKTNRGLPQVRGIARTGGKTQIFTDFGKVEITRNNKFINSALKNVKKLTKKTSSKTQEGASGQKSLLVNKKQVKELKNIEKSLNRVKKGNPSQKDIVVVNRFIENPQYRGLVRQSQPAGSTPVQTTKPTGREKVRQQIIQRLKDKQKTTQRQIRRQKLIDSKQKGTGKELLQRKKERLQNQKQKKVALQKNRKAVSINIKTDLATAFAQISLLSRKPLFKNNIKVITSSGNKIDNLNDVRSDTKPVIKVDVSNINKQDVDRIITQIPVNDVSLSIKTRKIQKEKQPKEPKRIKPKTVPKSPKKTKKQKQSKQPKNIKKINRNIRKKQPEEMKPRKIPKIPKDDKKYPSRRKKNTGYIGLVRSGKSLLPTHKKVLPRRRALRNAARIADNSTAASITIRKTKNRTNAKEIKQSKTLKKFRVSKRNKNILVEKRKYRIDSKGEKRGITAKGLLAKKNKAKRKVIKRKRSIKKVSRVRSKKKSKPIRKR